jgi:hypothetical protein
VKVDTFRRNLRRSLLEACEQRAAKGFGYRVALAATSSLCLVLAAVLVLFITRPAYPVQLHALLISDDAGPGFQEESRPGPVADGRGAAEMHPGSSQDGEIQPLFVSRPLLEQTREADRDFVRRWVEREVSAQPVTVLPMDPVETYTVSRFMLNDGRQVKVFTRVPEAARPREKVY